MTHELKIWPEHFHDVAAGRKRFEIRKNDRGFAAGDTLILKEYEPHKGTGYTGRSLRVTVTYLTSFAQRDDYVVLGFTESGDVFRDNAATRLLDGKG